MLHHSGCRPEVPTSCKSDLVTVIGLVGVCIPLAADIGCDITGCSEVAFTDLSSYIDQTGAGNNIVAWSWDFGDGNSVHRIPSHI